jgi:GH24 family phage-related lysozyme (muramidase)
VYNLGCGTLSGTLLADIHAKNWTAAANQVLLTILQTIFRKIISQTLSKRK